MFPAGIISVGNDGLGIFSHPLMRATWAFSELPFEAEKVFKIAIAPLSRRLRPGNFQPAGNGVRAFAQPESIIPSKAQHFHPCRLRLLAHMIRRSRTMGLAECMS